jgi:hypothetical protein
VLVALTAVLVFAIGAMTASLPGSAFEIDGNPTGANLRVDGGAAALDWANVAESREADVPLGSDDQAAEARDRRPW